MEHCEFLLKRLLRYCGANSLSDLKTTVFDSLLMSCSMVLQPNLSMSGLLGGVKAAVGNDPGSSVLKLL